MNRRSIRNGVLLLSAGVLLVLAGSYLGLAVAPAEMYMGDVQRIMYVHVPTAWNAMLALTFALVSAIGWLWTSNPKWDARHEAWIEIGIVLSALLCIQGSIWAKPTWGVWWDWDPRLTTMAVLLFAFIGILTLRRFVEDPMQRATWSAVATIIAYVDVPIVYFSVKWWNSLHQVQSTPETVSSAFHLPLRLNAFGILALMIGLAMLRAELAKRRRAAEYEPLPSPDLRTAGEVTS
ncbi:MAG: cytochrome c biogenesis protein CcsA [Acidobacteria bacterium]|nr:cytochrome c biogenesis protein CcsA [Acidobacteriota bacterium]